jgi:hypothetical protein
MAPHEPCLVPAIITQDDDPGDDGSSTRGGRVIVDADVDASALARVLKVLDRR